MTLGEAYVQNLLSDEDVYQIACVHLSRQKYIGADYAHYETQNPIRKLKTVKLMLPTGDLLDLVLDGPELLPLLNRNPEIQDRIIKKINFNGLSQLYTRKDAGSVILGKLRDNIQNGGNTLTREILGALLRQPEFLSRLDEEELAIYESISSGLS